MKNNWDTRVPQSEKVWNLRVETTGIEQKQQDQDANLLEIYILNVWDTYVIKD